jgi:Cu+-exporting ATPase
VIPPTLSELETESQKTPLTGLHTPGTEISHLHVYSVEGMTCASCASRVENKLKTVSGVLTANVNFARQKAYIRADSRLLGTESLVQAVENAGYRLKPDQPENKSADLYRVERMRLGWRVLAGGLLVFPFLMQHLFMWFWPIHFSPWQQLVLAFPLWLVVGWPFHQATLRNLRHGEVTMDTLVSLGSSAAFLSSLPSVFTSSGPSYFEAAGFIIFFVVLGRYLEILSRQRANRAMEFLLDLQPQIAHLVRKTRQEDLPVDLVVPGDTVCVRPGEAFPVDGDIEEGRGRVDESLLTGEAEPVEKSMGDQVFAGTMNGTHTLILKARGVGDTTALSRIIRLVEEAQGSKAPVQRAADKAAAVFVPVVLILALLTLLGWIFIAGHSFGVGLTHAISVLVIACPCALGLATPIALMVGIGVAAKRGILIRRAEVLEKSRQIDAIAFDKTGTLTEGKPRLVDFVPLEGWSEEKLLRYTAALEMRTNHPLASAVLKEIMVLDLVLPNAENVEEIPGAGVKGLVEGHEVAIGTKAFIESIEGVVASSQARANAEAYRQGGQTVSLVAVDRKIVAILAMEDPLRADSKEVVDRLKALGLKICLLSGDGEVAARRLGERLGLDDVKARMSPEGKMSYVRELQSQGLKVAMVGDGFNDAAALSASDLGIAMGSGTDVAKEAGDMVLMQGSLMKVVEAIQISRATFQVIRQNLFWAFGYNLIVLPLAIFGAVPPSWAALAMSLSSVSVVLNALRLYGKKF